MSNINIEYNLSFNNVDYIFILSATDDSMKINLETVNESLYWKGEFEAKYIEETTNKAGSYKAFPVFIKMFMSALSKESDSVFIDIMHYKQLEMVKMKKMQQNSINMSNMNESISNFGGTGYNNNNNDPAKTNKIYLIMTYNSEFEKVHYPFPMQFLTQPDTDAMLRTIDRMRRAINLNKNNNNNNSSVTINFKEIEEIKNENFNLKNKIKLLDSQRKFGAVENDEFIRTYTTIKEEYESYRENSESKIKVLVKTIEDLKLRLNSQNMNSSNNNVESQQYIKELQSKLEKASEIVTNERKQGQSFVDEKIRDIDRLQKEIHFLKENEKKLKVKINQLEKDLEIANKKPLHDSKSKINNNTTPKSNYSYKSSSVRSGLSYNSNTASKKSVTGSTSSNVKKNLQVNPYNKFKGLYNKNYSPFKFFDKNKSNASNKSVKSNSSYASADSRRHSSNTKSVTSNKSITPKKINYPIPKVYTSKNKYTNISNVNKGNKFNQITPKSNIKATVKNTVNNYIQSSSSINNITEPSKLKIENETKNFNANDINERLGRIQNLLNSAKV